MNSNVFGHDHHVPEDSFWRLGWTGPLDVVVVVNGQVTARALARAGCTGERVRTASACRALWTVRDTVRPGAYATREYVPSGSACVPSHRRRPAGLHEAWC